MKAVLIVLLSWLLILSHVQTARSDFAGPSVARHALSPDGKTLVRIESLKRDEESKAPPKHEVSYYDFDAVANSYVRRSAFQMTGRLSQMLYVSNSGDLAMIFLADTEAIRLYSKTGKLTKSWKLEDFLTKDEIEACAKTGSTLQWLEEGAFFEHVFYLRGPSQRIRALSPPFTVMRGVNDKVAFSASIDTKSSELKKHEPEDP